MTNARALDAARRRRGEVVCDECGRAFRMRPEVEGWGEGGECHWFGCPHCQARYVMAYVTAKGVRIRGQIAALKARLRETQDEGVRAALAQRWEDLQAMMAVEVTGG